MRGETAVSSRRAAVVAQLEREAVVGPVAVVLDGGRSPIDLCDAVVSRRQEGAFMSDEVEVGPAAELQAGDVVGVGGYAVGDAEGRRFAVTRRCRHLRADLADGSIDDDGCLVCPWHDAAYDVASGQMTRGPQGAFAKVPGLGSAIKMMTRVFPLGRGDVTERDGTLYVR